MALSFKNLTIRSMIGSNNQMQNLSHSRLGQMLLFRVPCFVGPFSCLQLLSFAVIGHCRAVFIQVSKRNRFALSTSPNWLKILSPIFHPMRSKTRPNRDS